MHRALALPASSLVLALFALVAGCSSAALPGDVSGDASDDGSSRDGAPLGADAGGGTGTAGDASAADASTGAASDASGDVWTGPSSDGAAGDGGCFLSTVGVWGDCISTSACAALGAHVSTPGYCPGPADIECCTATPSIAADPPPPAGWQLMTQSAVTAQMTTWAVSILDDPTAYPMFSTTIQPFGALPVLAQVEWHPPDFQNATIHRGVTLYVPTDGG